MKRTFFLIVVISLLLAGCSGHGNDSNSMPPSSSIDVAAEGEAENSAETSSESPLLPEDDLDVVMGASMYRGIITDISSGTPTDSGGEHVVTFTVEQYSGTNFGYPSLQFTIDENTRTNFEPQDLTIDMFVEIYYGAPMAGEVKQPVKAIQAKMLPDADLVYINGEVVEITPSSDGEGEILLKRIDNMNEVIVRYYTDTQFYLNFDDIREGYRINVFTSGVSTRSMPPQVNALEIRPYTELALP